MGSEKQAWSGVRGLHGVPWGQGAAGVPTWHTKQLPRSALATRSFVFSIRASWVGVVRAPRPAAPLPSWGRRLSPDYGDQGAPAGPRLVAAKAAPVISP